MSLPAPVFDADGITLYHGDALSVMSHLERKSFDALICDPPYSSGGLHLNARQGTTNDKYSQNGKVLHLDFSGDQRSELAWLHWSAIWLNSARELVRDGGYALVFCDWRMLSACTMAFQAGGWRFRGIIPWNKGGGARAPHTGYFRHQCEYIVWGTQGECVPIEEDGGPWPGFYSVRVIPSEKEHVTGKPLALMTEILGCVPAGGRVLDPFAGSSTTLLAARDLGRTAVGIEMDSHYCEISKARFRQGSLFAAI